MVNKGIVTKINGDTVAVRLYKSSSCSHCSCCSETNKMGSNFEFKINQKVELGDLVTLEISEKDVVKAAFIAYIFPPIFMILGYIVADHLGFSEMKSIIGSFLGLGVGFIFLAIYDGLPVSDDLAAFRWMIEELRVSLFAQELKTPYPVSVKRLLKEWESLNK